AGQLEPVDARAIAKQRAPPETGEEAWHVRRWEKETARATARAVPTHPFTNSPTLYRRACRRRELVVVRHREDVGQRLRQRCELRRRRHLHPFQLDVLVPVHTGAGRDEVPDDDVLLETEEIVLGPADGRIGEDARGLLER